MKMNSHPAPGMGDLMSGWFVVPQNPLRGDNTPLVPSLQALAPNQVLVKPKLGDFVAGSFVVPQNPVKRQLSGMGDFASAKFAVPQNPLIRQLSGMGDCGCSSCGGPNFYGMSGIDFSVDSLTSWAKAPSVISSIPNYALYGGAALAAMMFLGGGSKRGRR